MLIQSNKIYFVFSENLDAVKAIFGIELISRYTPMLSLQLLATNVQYVGYIHKVL